MPNTIISQPDSFIEEIETNQKIVNDIIKKIEAIADDLEAEAVPSEELGKLTDKAVELMFSSGIVDTYLPKKLGGMGLYPGEAIPILERVSYIDGSIGWVNTIFSSAGLLVNYLSDEILNEFSSQDEVVMFGAVSNGKGTAELTEDGWKISGNYRYASGIKHAQYVFTPAMKIIDGKPVPPPQGMGYFLVPTSEIELQGGWDTIGLRATGSVDFSVKDCVVPKDYELNVFAPPKTGNRAIAGGLVLNIPIMHLGFALGITKRILDEIKVFSNRKPPVPNVSSLAEKETFRIEYSQKYMAMKSARALVKEVMDDIDNTLRKGEQISTRQKSMVHAISIHSHEVARDVANFAFKRAGGTSLRKGVLQRLIRDAIAGCQHFIVNDSHYNNIGFDLLGAPDNYGWTGVFQFGPLPPKK